jgi:predicted ribosomally synthesized peptide with nif11-like leader
MSQTSATAFVERLKYDDDFLAQVSTCSDASVRMEFVRSEGYVFSPEELTAIKATFTHDDLGRTYFQESRLGYDSPLGHGADPEPEPDPKPPQLN